LDSIPNLSKNVSEINSNIRNTKASNEEEQLLLRDESTINVLKGFNSKNTTPEGITNNNYGFKHASIPHFDISKDIGPNGGKYDEIDKEIKKDIAKYKFK
jgi:hypothetical protein